MKRFFHTAAAFSLVEVTLALGVAGFCLIAVFGLLPVGVQTTQRSISQTAATAIVSSVIADLRATPKTAATSTQYGIPIPSDPTSPPDPPPIPDTPSQTLYFDSNGTSSTSLTTTSRYRLGVWFRKNQAGSAGATFAVLKVTWPAAVDPLTTIPAGSNEMFAAFKRN
jgi:uncharacterized protein (TIGR02598 family)